LFLGSANLELDGNPVIVGFTVTVDEGREDGWRGSFVVSVAERALHADERYTLSSVMGAAVRSAFETVGLDARQN
jgi:hypothetical protein